MGYQEALEAAGAEVLRFEQFGSYQGDWWAKVVYEGKSQWVTGSYGSCSGCDAFEGEFGWDTCSCEDHKWDYDAQKGCDRCTQAKVVYNERLAAFGREYLSDTRTQDEAETEASRNLEWDSDAQGMLDWLKANAL